MTSTHTPNDPHGPQREREGSTHDKYLHIPVTHMIPKRERVIKKYKPEGILRAHAINVSTLCRREEAQTAWALNERQGRWWWFEIKSMHSFRTTFESQLFVHVCQFPHTSQHSHLMFYKSFKAYTKDCMSSYHLKYHVIAYFIKFDSKNEEINGQLPNLLGKKQKGHLPWLQLPSCGIKHAWYELFDIQEGRGKIMCLCKWEKEIQRLGLVKGEEEMVLL